MKKSKIIIPSMLMVLACGSVIAGSTYALFTSESDVNIAITSGKVDVKASLSNLEAYSPTKIATDGTISDANNLADNTADVKKFSNGGTAAIEGGNIKFSNVTPGDKVSFEVKAFSESSVKAQYRVIIGCINDNGLFEGLKVSLDDTSDLEFEQNIAGITTISKYVEIDPLAEKSIKMSIELPTTAGDDYSLKDCIIECKVEAIQANAEVVEEANTLKLYSATDLVNYGKLEAACTETTSTLYEYTTIELMNDVDMTGIAWTPILARDNVNDFKKDTLVFEGNNHTISNLTAGEVSDGANYFSGFFGRIVNANIQNLTIESANITSTHYAGGIAGQLSYASKLTNCKVLNSTIVSTPEDKNADAKYDNGDKVGGLVGHLESTGAVISNCTVESCWIQGYRDIGGMVGYAGANLTITDSTIKSTIIMSDHTYNYKEYKTAADFNVGEIIGRYGDKTQVTETNNKATDVTIINDDVTE